MELNKNYNYLLVSNSSIGDSLAYTFPIAVYLNTNGIKPYFISSNDNVKKIFSKTNLTINYSYEFSNYINVVILTGCPGLHQKKFKKCINCNNGLCKSCGKNYTYYKQINKLIKTKNCIGEWYQYLNLNTYKKSDNKYRPKKIIETWGLDWHENMDKLNLDLYKNYYKDFNCNNKTILINLNASCKKRCFNKKFKKIINNYDVRFLDYNEDIRTNLFLINQVNHILTVDTSTAWIAKYLNKNNIYLISPGGLNRHFELGINKFIDDNSYRYKEINEKTIEKKLIKILDDFDKKSTTQL